MNPPLRRHSLCIDKGLFDFFDTLKFGIRPNNIYIKTRINTLDFKNSLLQAYYKHTILWDFGVNIPDHDNLEFINDKIREIDETFDLILMVENFQESMVLLKHEICWNYEDLASLRLNSHVDKTKSKIDQSAKEKLKEWLKTSYLFYDHFKVRFIIHED